MSKSPLRKYFLFLFLYNFFPADPFSPPSVFLSLWKGSFSSAFQTVDGNPLVSHEINLVEAQLVILLKKENTVENQENTAHNKVKDCLMKPLFQSHIFVHILI